MKRTGLIVSLAALLVTAGCGLFKGSPTNPTCEVVLLTCEGVAGTGNVVTLTLSHPDGTAATGVYEISLDGLSQGAKQDRDTLVIPLSIPPGGGPPTPTKHTVQGRRDTCFTSTAFVTVPF